MKSNILNPFLHPLPGDDFRESIFLDWFNNYLTVQAFAQHRKISEEQARHLIAQGRAANGRLSSH